MIQAAGRILFRSLPSIVDEYIHCEPPGEAGHRTEQASRRGCRGCPEGTAYGDRADGGTDSRRSFFASKRNRARDGRSVSCLTPTHLDPPPKR